MIIELYFPAALDLHSRPAAIAAAIDDKVSTGHVGARIRAQIDRRLGDVGWSGQIVPSGTEENSRSARPWFLINPLDTFGIADGAGRYRVAADAVWTPFGRQRAHQRYDSGLRRTGMRAAGPTLQSARR